MVSAVRERRGFVTTTPKWMDAAMGKGSPNLVRVRKPRRGILTAGLQRAKRVMDAYRKVTNPSTDRQYVSKDRSWARMKTEGFVLVDDKQAREKMARACEALLTNHGQRKGGSDSGDAARRVCIEVIRQTDLSDCKVEIGDATDASLAADELREISDFLVADDEDGWRDSIVMLVDSATLLESLSAQVAELQILWKIAHDERSQAMLDSFAAEARVGNAIEVLDSIRALLRGERHPDDSERIVEMVNGFLGS